MTDYSPEMIRHVATKFVRFLSKQFRNDEIYDSSLLPWPKETIIGCCLKRLQHEKNHLIRKNICDSLLCLAFYQDGVGLTPLVDCRLDLFTMDLSSLDEKQLGRVKLVIAEHLPHLESGTFLATLTLVQAEFKKLNELCESLEQYVPDTSFPADPLADVLA